ncbi:uncharacterized protein LOC114354671, partial [Ostrinia furnacalis]|uniref:uncharacterized protein LOC114354671 n=1 Tax=Ostrinia furnacalis TaxID=93504 RepID=UPI00103EFC54
MSGTHKPDLIARGDGFVVAKCGELIVAGVYFPPSRSVAEFEADLDGLGVVLQQHSLPSLVAGDFNAKATAWGARRTDVRGTILRDWAVVQGLSVLNTGTESTCVRPQGESIVDISFASPTVAHRVTAWRVMTEAESLSDHRYITFNVSTSNTSMLAPSPPRANIFRRWKLTSLDRDMMKEAALVKAWSPVGREEVEVEREVA